MKSIIWLIIALVVILGAIYLFGSKNEISYVNTVDQEIADLEADLVELDAMVKADTLDEEAATAAQTRITARIEAINDAINSGNDAQLTDAQKQTLVAALDKLQGVLVSYRATLDAVDKKAPRKHGSGSGAEVATDTTVEGETEVSTSTDEEEEGAIAEGDISLADLLEEVINDLEDHITDAVGENTEETVVEEEATTTAEEAITAEAEVEVNTEAEVSL